MFEELVDTTKNEFDSFKDIQRLYEGGIKLPGGFLLDNITKNIPLEMLKEIIRTDGEGYFKFPMPQVIKGTSYMHQLLLFYLKRWHH